MTSRRYNAEMRSAARHTLAEVVDFSPAPAQSRNEEAGRRTKSELAESVRRQWGNLPYRQRGGGGG